MITLGVFNHSQSGSEAFDSLCDRLLKVGLPLVNYGLLEHIRNFQGVHEKIYIRHRMLDDILNKPSDRFSMQPSNQQYDTIYKEMKDLIV